MNWLDGQKYCRENYTDLATIGSERENIDAATLVNTTNAVDHRHAWIGLHRDWTWSDNSTSGFGWAWTEGPTFWDPNYEKEICVSVFNRKMKTIACKEKLPFVCYGGECR